MELVSKNSHKLAKARAKRKSHRNAKTGNYNAKKNEAIQDMFAEKPQGYAVNLSGRPYYVYNDTFYRLD